MSCEQIPLTKDPKKLYAWFMPQNWPNPGKFGQKYLRQWASSGRSIKPVPMYHKMFYTRMCLRDVSTVSWNTLWHHSRRNSHLADFLFLSREREGRQTRTNNYKAALHAYFFQAASRKKCKLKSYIGKKARKRNKCKENEPQRTEDGKKREIC